VAKLHTAEANGAARVVHHPEAATDHLPAAVHKADQAEEKAAPVHQTAVEAVPDKHID